MEASIESLRAELGKTQTWAKAELARAAQRIANHEKEIQLRKGKSERGDKGGLRVREAEKYIPDQQWCEDSPYRFADFSDDLAT